MVPILIIGRLSSENDYYRQKTNVKSPLRWMSPDAIKGKFSGKSDCWAYGVTCWEIFSVGEMPYWTEGCYLEKPEEVMSHIFSKEVLSRPAHCPDDVYGHMKSCWYFSFFLFSLGLDFPFCPTFLRVDRLTHTHNHTLTA